MSDFESVRIMVTELSTQDRLRLMDAIVETLSAEEFNELPPEWKEEIARRSREIDEGTATLEDWDVAWQRIRTRVGIVDED